MIPCYLTNRDLLSPVRGMVEHLIRCQDVAKITIVDCGSSYPPLLEWYARECPVEVLLVENLGPHAPWEARDDKAPFYFVSDGDLDLSGVPRDFLRVLRRGLETNSACIKAGLSLRIDDLPYGPRADQVRAEEAPYWEMSREGWYAAKIDTTAALYRGEHGWVGYGPALRAAPPYTARHLAWYLEHPLPEEWRYYFEHLEPRGIRYSARWQEEIAR